MEEMSFLDEGHEVSFVLRGGILWRRSFFRVGLVSISRGGCLDADCERCEAVGRHGIGSSQITVGSCLHPLWPDGSRS